MTATTTTLTLTDGGTTTLTVHGGDRGSEPVLVVLPAMGVDASYYTPFAQAVAAEGVAVALADYTGQGTARPLVSRRSDITYAALAGAWVADVLAGIETLTPGRPVVLLGHSLGGQVVLCHLALGAAAGASSPVRAAVLVGAGSPHWRTKRGLGAVTLLAQTQLVGLITRLRGLWPGHRVGFGGRQAKGLMREWSAFARTGRLAPAGAGLAAVETPVFAIELDNDEYATAAGVDALVALVPNARVDRWKFTKAQGAPGRPVDHFSFARSPEVIAQRIADWVHAQVGPALVGASAPGERVVDG